MVAQKNAQESCQEAWHTQSPEPVPRKVQKGQEMVLVMRDSRKTGVQATYNDESQGFELSKQRENMI